MANNKALDMANLELAMSQNNEKIKGYVDASNHEIKKYQKYVNTELDYYYGTGSKASLTYKGSGSLGTNPIILQVNKEKGNMTVDEDNCILLKAGKIYSGSLSIRFNANISTSITITFERILVNEYVETRKGKT